MYKDSSLPVHPIRSQTSRNLWVDPGQPTKKRRRRRRRRKRGANHKVTDNQKVPPSLSLPANATHNFIFRPGDIVALDCEMVGVGEGGHRSMLARVAIVDWNGNTILDTFVKPTETVTDYRTFVSGVRPADIHSPGAIDYERCRSLVRRHVANKILVGHALYNDLDVLKFSHPWVLVRDSATYEPFLKHGFRPKRLKELADEVLGIDIQVEGQEHCPAEDARAALDIYKTVQQDWDFAIKWRYSRVLCGPLRQFSSSEKVEPVKSSNTL